MEVRRGCCHDGIDVGSAFTVLHQESACADPTEDWDDWEDADPADQTESDDGDDAGEEEG
jgi:hypothetical protein